MAILNMVFADEIRNTILRLAEEHGSEKSFEPADVARALDQQHWPQLLDQVKLVADAMIKEGKIKTTTIFHGGSGTVETIRFKKST
jgi:hypothetical protein